MFRLSGVPKVICLKGKHNKQPVFENLKRNILALVCLPKLYLETFSLHILFLFNLTLIVILYHIIDVFIFTIFFFFLQNYSMNHF